MATLGWMEMGKLLREGRDKSLPSWLSQFSFAKLRQPKGQKNFPIFPKELPISFKPKVLENAKKKIVFHFWVGPG
jgi:hypothetical protein